MTRKKIGLIGPAVIKILSFNWTTSHRSTWIKLCFGWTKSSLLLTIIPQPVYKNEFTIFICTCTNTVWSRQVFINNCKKIWEHSLIEIDTRSVEGFSILRRPYYIDMFLSVQEALCWSDLAFDLFRKSRGNVEKVSFLKAARGQTFGRTTNISSFIQQAQQCRKIIWNSWLLDRKLATPRNARNRQILRVFFSNAILSYWAFFSLYYL